MPPSDQLPEWAPKVPQGQIRRLYATDAQGILDPEQIAAVGWALWARCDSILTVTAAHYGEVRCPACDRTITRQEAWSADEQLVCTTCGWQLAWAAYHQTYRGKQLFGANAVESFAAYHRAFPQTQGPAAQMRQIDTLIHAFHVSLREVGRPVAANLIAGSLRAVIQLLDELAGGEASAAGLGDSRTAWRQTLAAAPWVLPFLPEDNG